MKEEKKEEPKIWIDNNIYLSRIPMNWILVESGRIGKDKKTGEDVTLQDKVLGYYYTLENAIRGYIDHHMMEDNITAKTMPELEAYLKKAYADIEDKIAVVLSEIKQHGVNAYE